LSLDVVSQRVLSIWSEWLRRYPTEILTIEGHADRAEEQARELSEKRARAARVYLISRGIDENRLNVIAYGDTRPIANENTNEAQAMNRRAVMIVE
jgi:peptidoglycan-associated lipoprotein